MSKQCNTNCLGTLIVDSSTDRGSAVATRSCVQCESLVIPGNFLLLKYNYANNLFTISIFTGPAEVVQPGTKKDNKSAEKFILECLHQFGEDLIACVVTDGEPIYQVISHFSSFQLAYTCFNFSAGQTERLLHPAHQRYACLCRSLFFVYAELCFHHSFLSN